MSRTRGPGNLVARRPSTEARTDAAAHRQYAAMIEQDLGGRRTTSYRAIDEGRPPSTLALLMRPLALFLFACLALVVVLLAWLWQAGILDRLRPAARPIAPPSSSWMGARRVGAPRPPDPAGATGGTAPPPPATAADAADSDAQGDAEAAANGD